MGTARPRDGPPFGDALDARKKLLIKGGFPTGILWILDENWCFEKDPSTAAGVKLGLQRAFTPHPHDAPKGTDHPFPELNARMVFCRLGTNQGRSICIQLCDPWLEPKTKDEAYIRRDDWLLSFSPGA